MFDDYNHASSTDTEDYIAFQLMPLTFEVGSVSGDEQCYDVVIIDDNVVEDSEIFFVTLTFTEPVLILSCAIVTINPDPADGKLSLLDMCSVKSGSMPPVSSCRHYTDNIKLGYGGKNSSIIVE